MNSVRTKFLEYRNATWCWAIGAAAVCAAGLIYSRVRYGSCAMLLSLLAGDPLSLTPALMDIGTIEPKEERTVLVRAHNLTSSDIQIVGGTTTCSCMTVDDLPLTIPAGSDCEMHIRVRAVDAQHEGAESMTFYTDHSAAPRVVARIQYSVKLASREADE